MQTIKRLLTVAWCGFRGHDYCIDIKLLQGELPKVTEPTPMICMKCGSTYVYRLQK